LKQTTGRHPSFLFDQVGGTAVSRWDLAMPETINILWTGGWDSTFQLVRCFIHGTADIQPIYIVDESRQSTAMELLTMKRIKQALRAHLPTRAGSLLPVRFCAVSDLLSNQRITSAYKRIHEHARIGVQYDWLARFCDQFGVSDLQLCIHKDDRAHSALQAVVDDRGVHGCRVSEKHAATDEYELFRFYSFPIFDMSKLEIHESAKKLGFNSIMNLTWFCQAPKNGKPCGKCLPCRFTVEEGLGWRVPYLRRLYGALLWTILRPAKANLKNIPTWPMR
jgi:7-cyano-7-deazaguanine synthase in queuosine biosynthesis